jgi:hypothetical protein
LDPEDFSLLSILKFRKKKDDFSLNRVVEHTLVSKFVSYVAENADENWRKVASILNKNGELKVSLVRFVIDTHIDTQSGEGIEKKLDAVKTTA